MTSDDAELALVDETIAAMRHVVSNLVSGEVEIRNGREAAEVLRALNEVRSSDESPKVSFDRTTIFLQAKELAEQAVERAALHEAVPQPEVPVVDTDVVERPSA